MTTREFLALRTAKARFIQPMILSEVRQLPDGEQWTYEAKLDGYRCLAGKNGGVTLWSRRGTLFTARFPEVARACEKLPPDTLLDGELVAIAYDPAERAGTGG
jgi:bifunctional non-homologous end joining protein LigD